MNCEVVKYEYFISPYHWFIQNDNTFTITRYYITWYENIVLMRFVSWANNSMLCCHRFAGDRTRQLYSGKISGFLPFLFFTASMCKHTWPRVFDLKTTHLWSLILFLYISHHYYTHIVTRLVYTWLDCMIYIIFNHLISHFINFTNVSGCW